MARVIGGILGNFRGKIGKVAAKIIEGETILCARPSSFKVSYTPKIIASRQKFAVTIALAVGVSDLPTLYTIWKLNKEPKMTTRNTFIRYNFNLSSTQAPTLNNIITPGGFISPVTDAAISANKITGTLAALESVTAISSEEESLSLNVIVCLTNPKDEDDSFYKIISLSKEVADFEFGKPYDFEINLDTENAALSAKYTQKIIYLAVVTKSADNKIIRYSRSYSKISE
jgi:hypothetical protein